MSDLLEAVVGAHGGLDSWRKVSRLVVTASLGGPFWALKGGRDLAVETVTVDPRAVSVELAPYPEAGYRSVLLGGQRDRLEIWEDGGRVVESRDLPRRSFPPAGDVQAPWDRVQVAYFASCGMWTYFTLPFLFTGDGVLATEIEPWTEGGQTWRRLAVRYPAGTPVLDLKQTYYFDGDFMLRRMDYHPDVANAPAAHYTTGHRSFGGLVFPTHREIHVYDGKGSVDKALTLITVDVADVQVITG
jgi:hypothetical protein